MKTKSALRCFPILTCGTLLAASSIQAAALYWSGNGITQGDAGDWDASNANWGASSSGTFSSVWNNGGNDTAVFGSTAGMVTLGDNIIAGGLTFNTTGFTINAATNSKTLSFGATNNTITLNSVAAATFTGMAEGTGNVILTATAATTAGTLTFNGASTGGWSGTTTINPGMSMLVDNNSGANQSLLNTTGFTINGGAISVTNILSGQSGLNFVNDSAAISFNGGGSFAWKPVNAGSSYMEETGTMTVHSGQVSLLTGSISSGTATLVTPGITRVDATSVLSFSIANGGVPNDFNKIKVTGAGTTAGWSSGASSNPIIGPWATAGTTASDYAVFSGDLVVAAATAASAESTWSTAHAATSNYTLANGSGSAANGRLSTTRHINTLRNTTTATGVTADHTADTITLAGHTFAAGDVVVFGGTTAPSGLSNGVPYYAINPVGDTFQVAATSGGTPINFTSNGTAVNITGGLTLPSGSNLGTRGILNGSAAALAIGGNGGAITLPAATSDNLYITAGSAQIQIDAPIHDNGAGVVLTLVKSGGNNLTLRNTSSTYSGGTVINSGTVNFTKNAWGANGSVTFGGTGTLDVAENSVTYEFNGTLDVKAGAVGTVSGSTGRVYNFSTLTGAGTLAFMGNAGSPTLNITSDASGFTGAIQLGSTSSGSQTIVVPNLGDSAGAGNIKLANGSYGQTQTFKLAATGSTGLTLDHRRIEFVSGSGTASLVLDNSSGNPLASFVINTDLAPGASTSGKTLQLQGSNTGANEFAGVISNTAGSGVVSLTKTGAGIWKLSGANQYSGATTISNGTLIGTNATQSFGTNPNGISIAGNGTLSLRNDNSVSFTNGTSAYNIGNTATGATINVDRVTGTGGNTITVGNLTTSSTAGDWALTFTGTNGVSLNAGTLNTPVSIAAAVHTITNNIAGGGSLTLASVFNQATTVSSPDLVFTGTGNTIITGTIAQTMASMDLTKNGSGTLTLNGDNTYGGVTNAKAGKLFINSDQTAASGTVNVAANATLGGTGTLGGDAAIANNGKLEFNLSTAAGSHDKLELAATKTLDFGANCTLTIKSGGGASPGLYTLITAPGGIGTLPAFTVNLPVGWTADPPAISGNDLVLKITSTGGGGQTPYEAWAGGAAFDADANGDGVDNGLAFLLGASGPSAAVTLPTVTRIGGDLKLTFSMRNAAARGTATLSVQHSSDLGISDPWTSVKVPEAGGGPINGATFTVSSGGPTTNNIVATISSDNAASGKLFARLQATP